LRAPLPGHGAAPHTSIGRANRSGRFVKRPYKSAVVRAPSVDFADMLPKPSSYGEALAAAEEPIPSTFPVKHVKKADGSIFPAQEYD